eukprot:TRINITY_DN2882_c0_g1_i1.p1 TRINITY_DN2882_c0_g1~~TRINITY_DN2882_c0_g1_i1.p1  ORF type:complete len:749 (+),score=164.23 TRINITY_DN2882_c0_g1_i1:199-2247(+)
MVRSDVQRNTDKPRFTNNTWSFSVGHNSDPKLHVSVNEVVLLADEKKTAVRTFGSCLVRIGMYMTQIVNGEKVLQSRPILSANGNFDDVGSINIEFYRETEATVMFNVYVHAAVNLPLVGGELPCPFALAKSTTEQRNKQQAKYTSTVAMHLRSTVWRQPMKVVIPEKSVPDEGVFIAIIDYPTKKYLSRFVIPVNNIQNSQQHNLGLVINEDGAYLLVSIFRNPSLHEQLTLYQHISSASMIVMVHVGKLLTESLVSPTTLLAFAREYNNVDDDFLASLANKTPEEISQIRRLPFTTVYLSDSDPMVLKDPCPFQVSHISEYSRQPSWNCLFKFHLSKDFLANAKAGIVIEVFHCRFLEKPDEYQPGKRVFFFGYCIIWASTLGDTECERRTLQVPVRGNSQFAGHLSFDVTLMSASSRAKQLVANPLTRSLTTELCGTLVTQSSPQPQPMPPPPTPHPQPQLPLPPPASRLQRRSHSGIIAAACLQPQRAHSRGGSVDNDTRKPPPPQQQQKQPAGSSEGSPVSPCYDSPAEWAPLGVNAPASSRSHYSDVADSDSELEDLSPDWTNCAATSCAATAARAAILRSESTLNPLNLSMEDEDIGEWTCGRVCDNVCVVGRKSLNANANNPSCNGEQTARVGPGAEGPRYAAGVNQAVSFGAFFVERREPTAAGREHTTAAVP